MQTKNLHRFGIRGLKPRGWAPLLERILRDHPEVDAATLAAVSTGPGPTVAVLAVYHRVYVPGYRLRELQLELARILPVEGPFEVLFARPWRVAPGSLAEAMLWGTRIYMRPEAVLARRVAEAKPAPAAPAMLADVEASATATAA